MVNLQAIYTDNAQRPIRINMGGKLLNIGHVLWSLLIWHLNHFLNLSLFICQLFFVLLISSLCLINDFNWFLHPEFGCVWRVSHVMNYHIQENLVIIKLCLQRTYLSLHISLSRFEFSYLLWSQSAYKHILIIAIIPYCIATHHIILWILIWWIPITALRNHIHRFLDVFLVTVDLIVSFFAIFFHVRKDHFINILFC